MKYNREKLTGKLIRVTELNKNELVAFLKELVSSSVIGNLPFRAEAYCGFDSENTFVYYTTLLTTVASEFDLITLQQAINLAAIKTEPTLDKNLMRGYYIKLTEENREDVKAFFIELDPERWMDAPFSGIGWCYGVNEHNGYMESKIGSYIKDSANVITLEEAKEMVKVKQTVDEMPKVPEPSTYPKMMWVYDDESEKQIQILIIGKCLGLFVGLDNRTDLPTEELFDKPDAEKMNKFIENEGIFVYFFKEASDSLFCVGQKLYTKDGRDNPNGEVLRVNIDNDVLVKFPTNEEWIAGDAISDLFYTSK